MSRRREVYFFPHTGGAFRTFCRMCRSLEYGCDVVSAVFLAATAVILRLPPIQKRQKRIYSLSWYEEEWYVQLSIFSHEHNMRRKQYEYKLWVVGCRFQVFKINSRKNDGFILVKQKAEWRSMSPGFGIFFFVAQKGCNELRVHITFDTSASTNDDIPSAPQSPGSATSGRRRL